MARSALEILQGMRAQLKILDPDISAEPITPEYKILATVAEEIASAEVDKFVLDYQFNIDTKIGIDLDKFVTLFSFARQKGRRSVGTVTFLRSSTASSDIVIPAGTQIIKPATRVSSAIIFNTIAVGVIYAGTTSAEIPIECITEGTMGNVAAGTITQLAGQGTGGVEISIVSNQNATSGGGDQETDAELRVRFKNTIFRNIAGTKDQFLALAIASRFASKANVIGPISRYTEWVQIPSSGPILSQIPYSKYTYPFDYYLTDGDTLSEIFYTPRGIDYTFNVNIPPTITINNSNTLSPDKVVLLEHSYCSKNSRNDPVNNIANYVDIFVSGENLISVTEVTQFPSSSQNFNTTSGSPYNINGFIRFETGIAPAVGNRFQELLWQPVSILPSALIIGNATYKEGVDYWLVKDNTNYKGSRRARNGIEWASGAASSIGSSTQFTLSYSYNDLPIILNELMDAHKQVTTDVLVHEATKRYFNVNLLVMYIPGFSRASVDQGIETGLIQFFNAQLFGAILQISDIIDIVHDIPGVDNVRLAIPADLTAYGILEVSQDGVTPISPPFINDFTLQDSDLPVLNSIKTTQRSQNTWT